MINVVDDKVLVVLVQRNRSSVASATHSAAYIYKCQYYDYNVIYHNNIVVEFVEFAAARRWPRGCMVRTTLRSVSLLFLCHNVSSSM